MTSIQSCYTVIFIMLAFNMKTNMKIKGFHLFLASDLVVNETNTYKKVIIDFGYDKKDH